MLQLKPDSSFRPQCLNVSVPLQRRVQRCTCVADAALTLMRLGYIEKHNARRGTVSFKWVHNTNRFQPVYVIGRPGVGKSTAMERWAIDDILKGHGVAFFDPHGSSVDTIMRHIPPHRIADTILIDFNDLEHCTPLNILSGVPPDSRDDIASFIVDTFYSMYPKSWGPQVEDFFYNTTAALLETADGNLMGIKYMLTSETFRARVLKSIKDNSVKDYWSNDLSAATAFKARSIKYAS
jgi:hypothetical protein